MANVAAALTQYLHPIDSITGVQVVIMQPVVIRTSQLAQSDDVLEEGVRSILGSYYRLTRTWKVADAYSGMNPFRLAT